MNVFLRESSLERRIATVLSLFVFIMGMGTLGYRFIEGWSWLEALYMTTITVTTVGFGELHELSISGQMFTIVLVVVGVSAFTYTFSTFADYLIAGQLQGYLAERKMKRQAAKLKDHYIICGFGRVGTEVAQEFQREGQSMVVIDPSEKAIESAIHLNSCLAIQGDAGDDDLLIKAGLERAKGLIAAADSDATNVMITLSAHAINPKMFIIARANMESSRSKLLRAGANRVLSPSIISGRSMAQMAIRPNVVEFLDVVTRDDEMEYWIEELAVKAGSTLDGMTVGDANIRKATGITILVIKRQDGQTFVSPTADTIFVSGDLVMAFGSRDHLSQFERMAHESTLSG